MEMVAAIVHQLTRNLSDEEVRKCPAFAPYFVDHTTGVYPTAASGFPWTAGSIQSTGDPIADLTEDLAAEQKARLTYDNILRLSDDPDVNQAGRRTAPAQEHGPRLSVYSRQPGPCLVRAVSAYFSGSLHFSALTLRFPLI